MRWKTAIVVLLGCSAVAFGQETPSDLPPIATSRFAVPASSFRELRMIGEPAPAPVGGETLHGDPVDTWAPGHTSLLLFWTPFVAGSAEHVARLQEVTGPIENVDGISIALGPKDRVETMLENLPGRNPLPPRTVVDATGAWRDAFLQPLGLTELPAIVAIDGEGRVLYHGPVRTSSLTLGTIVSGAFDPGKYRRDALEYGARMNVQRIVNEGRSRAKRGELSWDSVVEVIRQAIELDPQNTPLRVLEFDVLVADADRPDEAYEVGRKIMADFPTSPLTLNELAWHTVSFPNVSHRDLDFALEAARRANAVQGWFDSGMLDTLARVHWMRGESDEAIRLQTIAVGYSPDTWQGDETRENLRVYTDGSLEPGQMPRPYRSPRTPG